ncbi:MAG: class I SAM-dependent methyltransferase, partial [Gordonia polyisoprenivorans]|nr:class I SAM-dependent methyltransferase [Gordonia polyisoprenivorans]
MPRFGAYRELMTSTLTSPPVSAILDRLYEQAAQGGRPSGPRSAGPPVEVSPQAKADAAEDRYMAIARDTGILAYSLIRSARPAVVVEFGMSYGISALFLAAALRDNALADPAAAGHLYTTELSAKKVLAAEKTFAEAQLADLITILAGDARDTLESVSGPIGFVLLDGWKDLYVPVLDLLEPKLAPGAMILADNTSHAESAS